MVYFAVNIKVDEQKGRGEYDEYIAKVKPIVESHGGHYVIRSEKVTALDSRWQPDRFILIQFQTREALELCFRSQEYLKISQKRTGSVSSQAIIIEEDEENENLQSGLSD